MLYDEGNLPIVRTLACMGQDRDRGTRPPRRAAGTGVDRFRGVDHRAPVALRDVPERCAAPKAKAAKGSTTSDAERTNRSADEAPEAIVWRLRSRIVYLRAQATGRREVEIPRTWLRATLEIDDALDARDLAKKLAIAAGSRVQFAAGTDGGIVVTLEAVAPIADVRRVFDTWQSVTGKSAALLDRKREGKIRERLRDGYTVDRLEAAVRGAMLDPFLCGENDRGKKYLDIITIFRDGPQVERLEALAVEDGKRAGSVFRRART